MVRGTPLFLIIKGIRSQKIAGAAIARQETEALPCVPKETQPGLTCWGFLAVVVSGQIARRQLAREQHGRFRHRLFTPRTAPTSNLGSNLSTMLAAPARLRERSGPLLCAALVSRMV